MTLVSRLAVIVKRLKADVLALRQSESIRSDVSFQSLYGGEFTLSTQLINPKFCVSLPHRRSTPSPPGLVGLFTLCSKKASKQTNW